MHSTAVLILVTLLATTLSVAGAAVWCRYRLRERQRLLESRIEERTRALSAANEELEAFSYSVSHDLRAPVRHIRGYATALAEDCGHALDDAGRDYLERLRLAAARMDRLIDDLLELSRLSGAELQRDRIDLSALARETVDDLLSGESADRSIEISIQPGLVARGDPGLLRVVLQNLFGNALKYTAHEPLTRIRLYSVREGGVHAFCVEDNGVGFDMTYADRLFGPFQRLHAAGDFAGDGIGLATVARIIHRHDGIVWARGEPGNGAAFHFTLPEA